MNKKKIAFLVTDVFELGGLQRVVSVLANELNKKHEIEIICVAENVKIDRSFYNLDENIKVHLKSDLIKKNFLKKVYSKVNKEVHYRTDLLNKKDMLNHLTEVYYPKESQKKLTEFINSQNYDIVIASEGTLSIILAIIASGLNSKTIGWQHNSYNAYFETNKKYHWKENNIFKKYMKNLDAYVVLTDDDKNLIQKNFDINPTRIYNPLSFKSDEKSKCDNKNILFMGRLVEKQKGLDLLMEIFKIVADKNKEWNLIIIGDGPDKEKLKQQIIDLNLEDRVELKKFTSKVIECYLDASLFVSTSRWEGFGLVITEAMECGLSVIAFENSGPKEIINNNGENGILVPCKNVEGFAEKILYLINNPEELKKISQNSILRAKDFEITRIIKDWNDLIMKINEQ
jgi:glycosyltransferase involved in cell wall biosynthesis